MTSSLETAVDSGELASTGFGATPSVSRSWVLANGADGRVFSSLSPPPSRLAWAM